MRLFIAIKFSPEMENTLTELQKQMKEKSITGNYTNCRNLHLTLAFIGEYDDPQKVINALEQISFDPFRISLEERTGTFGDILWIGTKKAPALMSLAQNVRKALDKARIHYDRKKFKPHITLVRKARIYANQEKTLNEIKLEKCSMTVDSFSLMLSRRTDGRLVYTELGHISAKEKR